MKAGDRKTIFFSVGLSLLLSVALCSLFLPLLSVMTPAGETISFYGWNILAGGPIVAELPSGVYSFSFRVNIYLLVATQAYLLSVISCFLGRQSIFNRAFSLVTALGAAVLVGLNPLVIPQFSSLPANSVSFAYGSYLSIGFAGVAILGELVLLVFLLIGKNARKKNAEK